MKNIFYMVVITIRKTIVTLLMIKINVQAMLDSKIKLKCPEKILVWIAISEHGISKPLFRKSTAVTIDGTIYLEECLKKNLLPFIKTLELYCLARFN